MCICMYVDISICICQCKYVCVRVSVQYVCTCTYLYVFGCIHKYGGWSVRPHKRVRGHSRRCSVCVWSSVLKDGAPHTFLPCYFWTPASESHPHPPTPHPGGHPNGNVCVVGGGRGGNGDGVGQTRSLSHGNAIKKHPHDLCNKPAEACHRL